MSKVEEFEEKIAEFFGASHCVAVDSCTHAIELCLLMKGADYIVVPKRTYLSVPMLAQKLKIALIWHDERWQDYYNVHKNIFDAAVLWRRDSYIPGTLMCISFQFQKHLSLGRCGCVLLDNPFEADMLKHLRHDGREPGTPWRDQNIAMQGSHYYITEEMAQLGLEKLPEAIATEPRKWVLEDWPDLTQMEVFKR